MSVKDLYDENACSILWRNNWLESWSWEEYDFKKLQLLDKLVLVDMIGYKVKDSVIISDELFDWSYPEWTVFAFYCHSWWSSAYLQMQLAPQMPQYKFVNISWWIMALNWFF